LHADKEMLLVFHVRYYTPYFNIEASDFFVSALDLEILIQKLSSSRCGPRFLPDIGTRISKEVKLRQECISDDILPLELGSFETLCHDVVVIDSCANSIRPSLKRPGNMVSKVVTYEPLKIR